MQKTTTQHPPNMEHTEQVLRDAGIRPTAQRLEIAHYALHYADHPTANQVLNWARSRLSKVSVATVYNTLSRLVKCGRLKELRFAHLDKIIYDRRTDDHYHFLELETGRLFDIPSKNIKLKADLDPQFQIAKFDLVLQGSID